jgi:hypothetical protein
MSRLVGRQRDDALDHGIGRSFDHIGGSVDVGLLHLQRVVGSDLDAVPGSRRRVACEFAPFGRGIGGGQGPDSPAGFPEARRHRFIFLPEISGTSSCERVLTPSIAVIRAIDAARA